MKQSSKLLTTQILDYQAKIGPFFFKEFLLVFLSCTALFFLVLLTSIFIEVKSSLLVLVPGSFLGLVGLARALMSHKVTSPWQWHQWFARQFLKPHHVLADRVWRVKIK